MQNALAKSGLKLDQKKCSLFLAIMLNLPLNHQPKKAENGATTKNQQQIFIPMYYILIQIYGTLLRHILHLMRKSQLQIHPNLIPPTLKNNQPVDLKNNKHISYLPHFPEKNHSWSAPILLVFDPCIHPFKSHDSPWPPVPYLQRVQRHGPSHRPGPVHQERRGSALHRCSWKAEGGGAVSGGFLPAKFMGFMMVHMGDLQQ